MYIVICYIAPILASAYYCACSVFGYNTLTVFDFDSGWSTLFLWDRFD